MGAARRLGVVFAGVLVAVPTFAQRAAVESDADRMAAKLVAIIERGEAIDAPADRQIRTSFTDREVNAYFRTSGPEFLPEGLADPRVTIGPGGQLRARAIVDLDAALKPRERSWLDPLAWVGGDVEVTANGTLQASKGIGRFALERATLGGVAVPVSLLQELVTYYSRSNEDPDGFRLDEPFELPSGIQEVEWRPGQATVVQ